MAKSRSTAYSFGCFCFGSFVHFIDWLFWFPYLVAFFVIFFFITFPPTSKFVVSIIESGRKTNSDENGAGNFCHGISMRLNEQKDKSDVVQILPTTLVPSRMPKDLFRLAYEVQKDLLVLYHKVSFDYDFLKSTLAKVIKTDDFTKRLFDIYTKVYVEKCKFTPQPIVLNIIRADYMFHCAKNDNADKTCLRQVEVNTIAVGGAALAVNVNGMHKHVIGQKVYCSPDQVKFVPDNKALTNVAAGLAEAYRLYGSDKAIILIIIEDLNQNIMDQRRLEYEVVTQLDSQVRVLRLTLSQCFDQLTLNENSDLKLVTKDDQSEVALIYFRSGYLPRHYPSDNEWAARMMMEKSRAIKCPWIGAHLAGTKKVQQILANPKILAKFIDGNESRQRLLSTFAGLYGLDADDSKTPEIVEKACKNPENFVLKPQLEGGGNNIYDAQLAQTLRSLSANELEAHILMERLRPLGQDNVLVRNNQPLIVTKVDNELGIFGYLLGSKDMIVRHMECGHMVRTKPTDANEGGISTGAAGHDTPFLI